MAEKFRKEKRVGICKKVVTFRPFLCIISRTDSKEVRGVLEAFYRENYHIVYGYLLSLCADPDLAEELTAETFCKAVEKIKQYDSRYKASTWLCTIGRNLFYNECRRKKRFVSLDEAEWIASPSAENIHLQKEEAEQILKALNDVSSEQRQVFIMRLEGMNFRDIGLALGRSENWARVNFFRTKGRIRSEMEGER